MARSFPSTSPGTRRRRGPDAGPGAVSTFVLPVRGPFSLAASTRFLEGFAPASFEAAAGQSLELAFPVEGRW